MQSRSEIVLQTFLCIHAQNKERKEKKGGKIRMNMPFSGVPNIFVKERCLYIYIYIYIDV